MSSQVGNWLDSSGTSNLYIQTYVKGFVDMSGGNLVLRNNSIYVNTGDVSMGGRLFVQGNATFQTPPIFSGNNIIAGTIPASAISGGVQTNGMDLSSNQTAFGIKTFGNIITASAGIISYSDVSFGGNLVTKNIVGTSFNGGGLNQFNGITLTGTTLSIGSGGGSGGAGVDLTSNQTISGIKTFGNEIDMSGVIKFPDNSTMISNTDSLDWNRFLSIDNNTSTTLPVYAAYKYMAISANGQYITGVINGGQIYVSSNYGVTQTAYDSTRAWNSVSISANGQYQTAVVNSTSTTGYIYVSSNYGLNWSPYMTDTNRAWTSVSVSATGQYQTAVVTTGYIYVSSNYGLTWTPYMTDANRSWTSISISSSGQYQTAVVNGGYIYVSSNYGISWTAITSTSTLAWNCISISSTGQYQIATQITTNNAWVSKNYGNTWSSLATSYSPYSCSISGNGQYMFISQLYFDMGYYYYNIVSISNDFGSTISNTINAYTNVFTWTYYYIIVSSNSQYYLTWGGGSTSAKLYQTPYSKLITGNLVVSKAMTINYNGTNDNALTVTGDCAFTGGNVQLAINGGYVGIGTANMKNYLQITCNTTTAASTAPDGGSNHGIAIWNPSKSGSTIYTMALGVDYTTGAGYINAAGNAAMQPVCLNTRGGNVGIGTTTPSYTLDVVGNFRISQNSTYLAITPGMYQGGSNTAYTTYDMPGSQNHYFWDNIVASGTISGSAKYFNIPHPLDPSNTRLIHCAVEGPRHDLNYSGTVNLINGLATVNIDTDSCPMSPMRVGTFEALIKNPRIYLQNNETFDRVKGKIIGGVLNIECENKNSSVPIDWLIIAERNDISLMDTKYCDKDGYLITERNAVDVHLSEEYRESNKASTN